MGTAKTSVSRSRKSLDDLDDSPFEGLVAPAPANQNGAQQIASAEPMADGGAQVARPIVSATQLPNDHLSPNEIRDQLANGGVSPLEIQRRLLSDVFMTDEERSTYQNALHRDPSINAATKLPGLQVGPISASDALDAIKQIHLPNVGGGEHGHAEQYGAEGALAPQGLTAPQGIMAKVGMLAALGLFTPRSDSAAGGQSGGHGGGPSAGHSGESSQSTSPAGQATMPKLSADQSSANAGTSASNTASAASNLAQGHQLSTQQAFAPAKGFAETGKFFEPIPANQGWLTKSLWQSKGSPFAAVLKAIGTLLMAMFGFGKGGHPAHRRTGRH